MRARIGTLDRGGIFTTRCTPHHRCSTPSTAIAPRPIYRPQTTIGRSEIDCAPLRLQGCAQVRVGNFAEAQRRSVVCYVSMRTLALGCLLLASCVTTAPSQRPPPQLTSTELELTVREADTDLVNQLIAE